MNSSKKLAREGVNDNSKKNSKKNEPTGIDLKRIIAAGILVIGVIVMCIIIGVQQFKKDAVIKVNDAKYTMDDMMLPIYETESQYLAMNSMYQYYMGSTVWEAAYSGDDENVSSSATNAEGLKQQILDQTQEYEILYQLATKEGYKVTDEDKDNAKESAEATLKHLSFKQKLKLGFTKNKLIDVYTKRNVAMRYSDDNRAKTDETVDEAAAEATVKKDDYKQYDVDYFSVSLVTKEDKELKPEKREKRIKQLKDVLERCDGVDDYSTVLKENDEADQVTYNSDSFTEKDGWSVVTNKDILKKVKKLEKGEVSKVFEDDDDKIAFFVVMKDNTSTESYDAAVKEAITKAQEEKYSEWYEGVAKDFKVKVNYDIWNDIEIGTVTTAIVTEEDLQKWSEEDNKDSSEASSDATEETATSEQ